MTVDKMTADKMTADKMTADKMTSGQNECLNRLHKSTGQNDKQLSSEPDVQAVLGLVELLP